MTGLLQAWGGGNPAALDRVVPIVHQGLHRQTQRYLQRENQAYIVLGNYDKALD